MKKTATYLLFASILFCNATPVFSQAINIGDSLALVDLYNNTNGTKWSTYYNLKWLTGVPIGSWGGVDTANGRVIKVDLHNLYVSGTIPASIGNLTMLSYLDFSHDSLKGEIPSSIGNLLNLEYLDLSSNQLTGEIPSTIGNLQNISTLDLSFNLLEGAIPSSIGNLSRLISLYVGFDSLSGTIPPSIGNLTNLETLDLGENKLSGQMPANIGDLINLKDLDLSHNQLTGEIPVSIGNLLNLESFAINSNVLSGSIPNSIGNLTNLFLLSLAFNQLSGQIPAEIGNLTQLNLVQLQYNQLSDQIPVSMGNLSALEELDLYNNQLTGPIPSSLGNLTQLKKLFLQINYLSGPVPASLANLINLSVSDFDISSNNLTFEGLEYVVQKLNKNKKVISYQFQAPIKITQHSDTLSVAAGGTLSNNTYKWQSNNLKSGPLSFYPTDSVVVGDSVFIAKEGGQYSVSVTNVLCPGLTLTSDTVKVISKLNPNNYGFLNPDGTLATSSSFSNNWTIDPTLKIVDLNINGAATDGITKVVLVADATAPVKFSIKNDMDGLLSSLNDQLTMSQEITIAPNQAGKAVCLYTAPDSYGKDNPVGGRNIVIEAIFSDTSLTQYITLKLATPPVVLIHGMWSSPSVWYDGGFTNILAQNKFEFTTADYSKESSSSFNPLSAASLPGRAAVSRSITDALAFMRSENIAVTQVDIVAHSLGGLMTRSWSQQNNYYTSNNFKKGYIHKLITLATPHRGSPLGPELIESQNNIIHIPFSNLSTGIKVSQALASLKMPIGFCHIDFGIQSAAINALSITPPYLTHAILGDYKDGSADEFVNHLIFDQLAKSCLNHPYDTIMESRCGNGAILDHDLIVPRISQSGYGSRTTLFTGVAHSFPASITETNSADVQTAVTDLLISNDKSQFGTGFPAPSIYDLDCNTAKNRFPTDPLETAYQKAPIYSDKKLDIPTGYLQIISPTSGDIFQQNSDAVIKLQFNANGGVIPVSSLFMIENTGWYSASGSSDNSVSFTLPKNTPVGKINIVLVAKGSDGIIYGDTSHIFITPEGSLDSISVDPKIIQLDSTYREQSVYVHGYYTNAVGMVIDNDITNASTGTVYSSIKGTVFNVDEDGLVTGNSGGTDTLVITNNGQKIKVPVIQNANFASATLYPNIIDFPAIPDKYVNDPPFGISAFSTSGKETIFSVVSGPAIIENGIVVLTGQQGIVTISATSVADVYFNAATPVIQTFNVIGGITPVTLLNFTAIKQATSNMLTWETSMEYNSSYFIVEKSNDGILFSAIQKINATGNSSITTAYTTTDYNPSNGSNYYRLKIIDNNGAFTYSNIREIQFDYPFTFNVSPNPINNNVINLSITSYKDLIGEIIVNNIDGRNILMEKINIEKGKANKKIQLAEYLPNGIYSIELVTKGNTLRRKIIKAD